jgi:hypothetical protein
MSYADWEAGYRKGMVGPDLGVDALLSNEAGRRNGFGGGHLHSESRIASEVLADDGMSDLTVVAVERKLDADEGMYGAPLTAVPAAVGDIAVRAA